MHLFLRDTSESSSFPFPVVTGRCEFPPAFLLSDLEVPNEVGNTLVRRLELLSLNRLFLEKKQEATLAEQTTERIWMKKNIVPDGFSFLMLISVRSISIVQ